MDRFLPEWKLLARVSSNVCNAPGWGNDCRCMQMDDAKRLRDEWTAKGSPVCGHPHLIKEYYLGSQTGDKVCTSCGEDFSRPEWKAREQR